MRHATKMMFAFGVTLFGGTLAACGGDEPTQELKNQPDNLVPKGRACGGLTGLQCAKGQFCNYPEAAICGAADATGLCAPIPQVCNDIYAPVCGCDDKTYPNDCDANRSGVSVASKGECNTGGGGPTDPGGSADAGGGAPGCGVDVDAGAVSPVLCGGFAGLSCPKDQWCNYEVTAGGTGCVGISDASGVCQPQAPQICTREYDPVCGCDGKTYGNACTAHAAGASIATKGECAVTDPGPPPPSDGQICGGLRGAQCAKGEFCDFDGHTTECGLADGTGVCKSIPEACTLQYDPVCGCDGKTYGNACSANAVGVSVASKGECGGAAAGVNCDQRDVVCKKGTPKCPSGTVPSVVDSCYGDCVAIDQCVCTDAPECPQPDVYSCHRSAGHCGPYVN